MQYLLLIYGAENDRTKMSETERNAMFSDYRSTPTRSRSPATTWRQCAAADPHRHTVRVRGGKPSTTDGPFAETREQLGG